MTNSFVHVAVGVVRNATGDILIARRPSEAHQGGKWEFPGGKVQQNETVEEALERELQEEVAIHAMSMRPLIQVHHRYPDNKQVWLDVWQVDNFRGEPHGCEDQPIRWCSQEQLSDYDFPAADHAILQAIDLPDRYLITGAFESESHFHEVLERNLLAGIKLVQFRAKMMDLADYVDMAVRVIEHCHDHAARILLNANPVLAEQLGADGVHLTSSRLLALEGRPLSPDKLVGASVHNREQLQQANRCNVNFSVIAPVLPTTSHPETTPLDWDGFAALAGESDHPVYALGGLGMQDLACIWRHGGQGVAAISSLWEQG